MPIKKDAVVAIIQKADTFLFIKRSDYINTAAGYWCPVSGRIEENETQIEALQREVKEEAAFPFSYSSEIAITTSISMLLDLHQDDLSIFY